MPGDLLQRGRDQPGGLPRGGSERARRGHAAGQLGKRLAGPVPRQELAVPQVYAGAHDPRPILHRRGHPVRGLRLRFLTQPHSSVNSWCSVTAGRTGGMSTTCRRSIPATGAPFRDFPQHRH